MRIHNDCWLKYSYDCWTICSCFFFYISHLEIFLWSNPPKQSAEEHTVHIYIHTQGHCSHGPLTCLLMPVSLIIFSRLSDRSDPIILEKSEARPSLSPPTSSLHWEGSISLLSLSLCVCVCVCMQEMEGKINYYREAKGAACPAHNGWRHRRIKRRAEKGKRDNSSSFCSASPPGLPGWLFRGKK